LSGKGFKFFMVLVPNSPTTWSEMQASWRLQRWW